MTKENNTRDKIECRIHFEFSAVRGKGSDKEGIFNDFLIALDSTADDERQCWCEWHWRLHQLRGGLRGYAEPTRLTTGSGNSYNVWANNFNRITESSLEQGIERSLNTDEKMIFLRRNHMKILSDACEGICMEAMVWLAQCMVIGTPLSLLCRHCWVQRWHLSRSSSNYLHTKSMLN